MKKHGPKCGSKTIPLTCKYCGKEIFYFSCNCGCSVLFDELGGDWPHHHCLGYTNSIEGQTANQIVSTSQFTFSIDRHEGPYSKQIRSVVRAFSDSTAAVIDAPKPIEIPKVPAPKIVYEKVKYSVLRVEPDHNKTVIEDGIVRETNFNVNLYTVLKLEKTMMSAKLLGKLADYTYAQITMHTGASSDGISYSFTFYVKQNVWKRKSIITGDHIICNLRGFHVPSKKPIWICETLKSMG